MATHSSILACRISQTEETGGLKSMRLPESTQLSTEHAHEQKIILAKVCVTL